MSLPRKASPGESLSVGVSAVGVSREAGQRTSGGGGLSVNIGEQEDLIDRMRMDTSGWRILADCRPRTRCSTRRRLAAGHLGQ